MRGRQKVLPVLATMHQQMIFKTAAIYSSPRLAALVGCECGGPTAAKFVTNIRNAVRQNCVLKFQGTHTGLSSVLAWSACQVSCRPSYRPFKPYPEGLSKTVECWSFAGLVLVEVGFEFKVVRALINMIVNLPCDPMHQHCSI